ncbi:MAG TPA: D-alanyl-D-alanine carboxypeptidase/D-alanyl-D-alanine-endopeptidase [Pyrinomonadaceae bacterium]|nr:D-alanyl-D-alanine carboxypeptidase/D-alanyl-D-alanine-endopeptidase [Pyrinomonadaceae bacterium]
MHRPASLLLLLVLHWAAVSTPAQRERRASTVPPIQVPATKPKPDASPSPTPADLRLQKSAASQSRLAQTTKTLAELQARIAEVLKRPELSAAMVGVKVASLETNRILFEENANKLLRPASNMKLYTVAAALDRLSPDYRFTTSVYARNSPDAAGTLRGDLTIYGRGDPSIAARFNNGDYLKAIDELAARIAATGLKRVEGDLVGDETYFTGPQYGSGWEWEDLQWWYGAEVSALTVNDNALDLFVKPGLDVGSPATITTGPPDPLLTITNRVTTAPKGSRRDLTIHRGLGENVLNISGSIALDDSGYSAAVGISHPALLFVYLLRASLAQKGVIVTGKSRTTGPVNHTLLNTAGASFTIDGNGSSSSAKPALVEIATMQSPPLSLIAAETMKVSQNLYTELILRTLGKVISPPVSSIPGNSSENAGIEVVKAFLKEAGINPEALVLTDGSGLSRNDMVTADATLALLTYMIRRPQANAFREALPIAGVDGTLRNRFRGTAAESNVRAKTGSLSSAASLSGYLTTAAGENLVFSIMVNNFPEDVEPRPVCIDPIVVLLASFAGRS